MRRIFKSRKRAAGLLSVIAVLAIAGGAYAYLTSTGTGSNTGDVTATTSGLTLTASQPAFTALGQTQNVSISAQNTSSSAERVASVTVTPSSTNSSSCPTGSFTAGTVVSTTPGATSFAPVEVPANSTVQIATVPVTFNDLSSAQNGCLATGAVTYSLSSN